jgi:hypothetical protein
LSVLKVKKGDLIFVRSPLFFSPEAIKNFGGGLKQILTDAGIENKIVLLDEGMDIKVLENNC